jgi:acyl dehydratase
MSWMYAEDLKPGMEFRFGRWPMTEEDIISFAKVFDAQPMHIDPQAAAAGQWGGIIASGLHTMSIYQSLLVDALWNDVVGKAGRNVNGRLRRPVRPGMVLTGKATVLGVIPRPEKGDAVLELRSELVDETSGEVVCIVEADAVLLMRPSSGAPRTAQ